MKSRRLVRIAGRAARLKCPRCGLGSIFRGWFAMNDNCPDCDLKFEREQGYFVGAIYMNYAATVLIAIPGYFIIDSYAGISLGTQLILWIGFALVFPILFFRPSRSLWLGLEYFFNPAEPYIVPRKKQASGSAR